MMVQTLSVILLLIFKTIFFHQFFCAATDFKSTNGSSEIQRIKRSLTYPHGSILQMSLGIIVHPNLGDPTLNINFGFQQNIPLPSNITQLEYPPTARAARKLETLDLYRIIEYQLKSYGFHEDCLKKIICEIAFSPLGNDGVLENIISHILTPTTLNYYSSMKTFQSYEEAEDYGSRKKDCNDLYGLCPVSPLESFSKLTNF